MSLTEPVAQLTPAQRLLLDYLHDHDAECPVCSYNLKSLTRPVCPECGHELKLTVGAANLRLGWLLVAVAPGFFSMIAAFFVLILIIVHLILLGSTWKMIAFVDTFGWMSGIFTIILARRRHRFLALQRTTQIWWAACIWAVHVAALGGFILLANLIT